MPNKRYYTDEEKAELLSNPYTARVTDCKVTFTRAFKQFALKNIDKPGMTSRKVFELAGYRSNLFSSRLMTSTISAIRKEAASPEGLREPAPVKKYIPRKKHSKTEYKELEERIAILEQQVNFLKKSQFIKQQNHSVPPNNSG